MRWQSTTPLHGSFNTTAGLAFGGGVESADELAALDPSIFGGGKGLGDSAQDAVATEYLDGFATAAVLGVDFAHDGGRLGFTW